ncbi:polynucleotidyl transferase, ribonuclease H-like superfamily protein [Wolffia australiana]
MKLVKPIDLFMNVTKVTSKHQRLLGLDVGNKYIGLAVSDTFKRIASPLSVLVRKKTNIELIASDFQRLVSELSLAGLIVGYPFRKHSKLNLENCQLHVEYFVKELGETGKLNGLFYTYWDEHYTSKCVESLIHPLDLHPVEAKTIIDKFAAVGILQGYLDAMQRNQNSSSGKECG